MIAEIWGSYRRLPLWVELWVAVILVPVNAASLAFVAERWACGSRRWRLGRCCAMAR
jgi:hypothetical protein